MSELRLNNLFNNKLHSNLFIFLMLAFIWISMIFLVNPIGDFPLIDDWAFAKPIYSLINQGRLEFTDWQDMTLITQIFWGLLFCLPHGFSFTALRISTLLLGLIGVFVTYRLLEEVKLNRRFAFIGALLVATNPLYFALSNTFMTDVPFFTLALLSFLFFARGIRIGGAKYVLFGTVLACLAIFIRQIAIIIPFVFVVTYLAKNGINKRTVLISFLPVVALIGIVFVYQFWIQPMLGLPAFYSPKVSRLVVFLKMPIGYVIHRIEMVGVRTVIYLGLFLLPILLLHIMHQWQQYSNKKKTIFIIFLFSVSLLLFQEITLKMTRFPEQGNILRHYGIDPVPLYGSLYLNDSSAGTKLLIQPVIAACVGASIMLWNLFLAVWQFFLWDKSEVRPSKWLALFVGLTFALYLIPLASIIFFDRYLIFVLPLSMLLMIDSNDTAGFSNRYGIKFHAIAVILLIYCIFTTGLTHDYLLWNKTRWRALRYLTLERNIPHKEIDGGFEFNGWYNYNRRFKMCNFDPEFWVNQDAKFIISFRPISGYDEIKKFSYKRWIPFKEENIFVLRKSTK